MAFAALQTDPKLNMVQVAGLLYPTLVQKPSHTEHSFTMKDYCTVFQAETAAIKHAAQELITFNNQQITFWSDSLSALQALSNKIHNHKSINDCHKALIKLADENTVQLKWIKSHTGHWGNEKADELAKAGTVSSNLVCSLVLLNHIKNMINDKVNSLTPPPPPMKLTVARALCHEA